jgi:hypothetical protein
VTRTHFILLARVLPQQAIADSQLFGISSSNAYHILIAGGGLSIYFNGWFRLTR